MARKSTSGGTVNERTRSARNGTLPFSTATSSTPSGYAAEISPANRLTPARSSSAVMSTRGSKTALGREVSEGVPQHRRPQPFAQCGQLGQRVHRLVAGLGVPLLEQRHDDLLEEP